MTTLREYVEVLGSWLGQLMAPDAPMGPPTPENRTIFVEGYRQALVDIQSTWLTNELWTRDVVCTDFLAHRARIEAQIEARLGLVAANTPGMAAGGPTPGGVGGP